jgi:hypothetical protein
MQVLQAKRWQVALVGLSGVAMVASFVGNARAADEQAKHKLLFYHRSQGFQHSVVTETDGKPCYAENVLRPICEKHGWELTSTKDGRIFTPENIAKFDAFLFYTTGDLTAAESKDGSAPMSKEGKKQLLEAIHGGKGFVGFHCASDTFHSPGQAGETQPVDQRDPYINMLGGEFIVHGAQQKATMTVADAKFPGCESLGDGFTKHEEWYALKNFGKDLHVVLINETKGMNGPMYERPAYPESWIRLHGDGRVFYTSMGHREDVWTSPEFQSVVVGGISWAVREDEADTTPNIDKVTPKANELPRK